MTSGPRVLMVTGAYAPELSGGGLQCKSVIETLRGEAQFAVLTTSIDPTLPRRDQIDGVPVYRVYVDVTSVWSKLVAGVRMARVLWRERHTHDIVHLQGFSQKSILVIALARLLGKKILLTPFTAEQDEPMTVRSAGGVTYAFYRAADLFLAISGRVAESYRAAGLPEAKLWMASSGLDIQRFSPATDAERDALRRRLELDPGRLWILFVGFFSRDKGPQVLFEAWMRLTPAQREKTGLVFVGATESAYYEVDSAIADTIRRESDGIGSGSHVVLRPQTGKVEDYFRAVDVFVFPSRRETYGMVLAEAMACGLPSVSSRLPGSATDHVEHMVNGWLVPPQDVDAVAEALGRLIDDPELRRTLGRRAREAVVSRFDLRRTARCVLDAYRHVLGAGPVSPSRAA